MKIPAIDALIRRDDWAGLLTRLILASILYVFIYWSPHIYTWIADMIFSYHSTIDERKHRATKYFGTALYAYTVIISTAQAFILLKRMKK